MCDSLTDPSKGLLCPSCARKLPLLEPVLPGEQKRSSVRQLYLTKGHDYDGFAAAFAYKDEIRRSVLRFKYSGRAEYAAFFGMALWVCAKDMITGWQSERIVPVPGDEKRIRSRGYNQAELLAKEISRLAGIGMDADLIRRTRQTKPQNGLDHIQRRINVASAFACGKNAPSSVIVVDDIMTTGSTMDAVAGCLKEAGAQKVYALCLCVD